MAPRIVVQLEKLQTSLVLKATQQQAEKREKLKTSAGTIGTKERPGVCTRKTAPGTKVDELPPRKEPGEVPRCLPGAVGAILATSALYGLDE